VAGSAAARALLLETLVQWNYTTVLNIVFLAVSAVLVWRFLRTGGPKMLRMMAAPSDGLQHGRTSPLTKSTLI